MDKINFYEGKYYLLSNFSAHRVVFNGVDHQTAEHAYQYEKFSDSAIKDKIKNAASAFLARQYGQTNEGKVDDWEDKKVEVMEQIMRAKMQQHQDVKQVLKETGELEIVKNHPDDYFWGSGADGRGENIMGKIWIKLRKEI